MLNSRPRTKEKKKKDFSLLFTAGFFIPFAVHFLQLARISWRRPGGMLSRVTSSPCLGEVWPPVSFALKPGDVPQPSSSAVRTLRPSLAPLYALLAGFCWTDSLASPLAAPQSRSASLMLLHAPRCTGVCLGNWPGRVAAIPAFWVRG